MMNKESLLLMGDVNAWCYTSSPRIWTVQTSGSNSLQLVPTPVLSAYDFFFFILFQFIACVLGFGLCWAGFEPKLYLTIPIALSLIGWGGLGCTCFAYKMLSRLPSSILELDLVKQECYLYGGEHTFRTADIEAILFVEEWVNPEAPHNVDYSPLYEVQLLVNDGHEVTRHWLIAGVHADCCFPHGERIADFASFKKEKGRTFRQRTPLR